MTNLASLLKHTIEHWSENLRDHSPLRALVLERRLTPRALGLYLESLRYLFHHSPRNLIPAAERAIALGEPALAEYFERKAGEEKGHDAWASQDLARLPRSEVGDLEPAPAVIELVELQRRLIAIHPLCFAAYVQWAEYFTVLLGDQWLDALSELGYDRSQLTAVAKHVEADRDHAAHGFAEFNRLWTGTPDPAILLDAIRDAGRLFERFCVQICEEADRAA